MLHKYNSQPLEIANECTVILAPLVADDTTQPMPNSPCEHLMDVTISFPHPIRLYQKTLTHTLFLVTLFGFLGGITCKVILFQLEPTTTLIIVPESQTITATTTLTVVTDTPNASQVPGRMLSAVTLTQEKTVPTTEKGHQDAQVAHGWVTLYNALPIKQTVLTGTLLVGHDGVQVVTGRDAVIPASSLLINGQVTIPAYAVHKGSKGNIVARDIYGPCCRANVFAQNMKAFIGGMDARNFPIVSSQDVNNTISMLKTTMPQSVQVALSMQVHDDETLVTPVACTPQVSTDHVVGTETKQVTVTMNEFCRGEVYTTQALHRLIVQAVKQHVAQYRGVVSMLSGEVTDQIERCTVVDQHRGIIRLQVKGTAIFKAYFTQEQIENIATVIAGNSRQEAIHKVLCLTGVRSVSFNQDGRDTSSLPNNPRHIHLVISR